MAKFRGEVGYAHTEEKVPGVWSETFNERIYYGDVTKDVRRWQNSEYVNDDLTINNVISIVADPYALKNFFTIRYVNWMGVSWKVTNVEVQAPRLILTLGGVYNGDKVGTT